MHDETPVAGSLRTAGSREDRNGSMKTQGTIALRRADGGRPQGPPGGANRRCISYSLRRRWICEMILVVGQVSFRKGELNLPLLLVCRTMKTILVNIIWGWIALFISLTTAFAQVPSSLAGDGFLAAVSTGVYPLASYGYYLFIPANSGNTYQTIGIYNVTSSSGTYTYAATSASTATLNVNDSLGGAGVLNASFTSASSGSYYEYLSAYPSINQSGSFGFSYINAPSSLAGRTVNCSVVNGASPFYTSGSYTITIAASGNTYIVSLFQLGSREPTHIPHLIGAREDCSLMTHSLVLLQLILVFRAQLEVALR